MTSLQDQSSFHVAVEHHQDIGSPYQTSKKKIMWS